MVEDEPEYLYFTEFNLEELTALTWEDVGAWPLDFCKAIQGIYDVATARRLPTDVDEVQDVALSLSAFGVTVANTLTALLSDVTLKEYHGGFIQLYEAASELVDLSDKALLVDDALTVDVVAGALEFWEAWQRAPALEPREWREQESDSGTGTTERKI